MLRQPLAHRAAHRRLSICDLWHADHALAVADGGGETGGLANLSTLCVPCHNAKSALEKAERARSRAAGRSASSKRVRTSGDACGTSSKRHVASSSDGDGAARVYRCAKCGLPKKGHVCSAATSSSERVVAIDLTSEVDVAPSDEARRPLAPDFTPAEPSAVPATRAVTGQAAARQPVPVWRGNWQDRAAAFAALLADSDSESD